MADFNAAFDRTMGHEGGYAHDPADRGGETYRGIARRFHPRWPGWRFVDACKDPDASGTFRDRLPGPAMRETLDALTRAFYRERFWDPLLLSEIEDQALAEELFDTGVNMGTGRAAKFLQRGLNALNRNARLYEDLVEDGALGDRTLRALQTYLRRDSPALLHKILNVLQGAHYLAIIARSPDQERFARGWFKRVVIGKGAHREPVA